MLAMLRTHRFNEFPNEGTHAMYVSCVELMVLPVEPHKVGEHLVDVSVSSTICPRSLDPFYIVSYYINWAMTSWTYSFVIIFHCHRMYAVLPCSNFILDIDKGNCAIYKVSWEKINFCKLIKINGKGQKFYCKLY